MIFYPCYKQDIWVNLQYIESLSIEKNNAQDYEIRAHLSYGGYYVLEDFNNREECLKFIEYLLRELDDS